MLSPTTSELSAVTELNLENTLNTYTEPPHCINILLAQVPFLHSSNKWIVELLSRCLFVIGLSPVFNSLLFVHRIVLLKPDLRGGQPYLIFPFTLTTLSNIGAGCGSLGKALGLRVGMCGLWQVCCISGFHILVILVFLTQCFLVQNFSPSILRPNFCFYAIPNGMNNHHSAKTQAINNIVNHKSRPTTFVFLPTTRL